MIKLSATVVVAIVSSMFSVAASAAAQCEGPIRDGNTWNLICAADDTHESEDDYQCDYFISLTYSQGIPDQQEATGSVSPGQSGVVIWSSAVHGDDTDIVSASIASGSCTR
jgi:hypothetical protein